MPAVHRATAALLGALALACGPAAVAGRPMLLDDAGVEPPGAAHVESWFAHGPGAARLWTIAPAYGLRPGLELSAALARDPQAHQRALHLAAKWQPVPPAADAPAHCYAAVSLALDQPAHGARLAPGLNGILSCPAAVGTLHLNAGLARAPRGGGAWPAGGIAWEQPLGAATAHVEWVLARGARALLNLGLRLDLTPALQLDGSVGRDGDGPARWSLGLKLQY